MSRVYLQTYYDYDARMLLVSHGAEKDICSDCYEPMRQAE